MTKKPPADPPKKTGRPRKVRIDSCVKSGLTYGRISPLAYLLAVLNDPDATQRRRDMAARAAAPYCHPRMDEVGKKAAREIAALEVPDDWADVIN